MINKIQDGLKKIVQILSAVIAIFVLVTILFTKLDREGKVVELSGRFLLEDFISNFLIVFMVSFLFFVWKKTKYSIKDKFISNRWKMYLLITSMVLLFAQIFFTYNIYFYAGADAEVIRIGAENFVNEVFDPLYNQSYYQRCPNNLMIYMIYIISYYIANFLGWTDGYIILIGCNILLANIAVLLTALSVYKMTQNKKIMWLAYVFSVLLFGITPWLSVPYTNMLSITSPILSFYIYLCLREKKIPIFIKWFMILLIPLFMYGVKPLNIIIGIAIILCELLYFNDFKGSIKRIASFIMAVFMVIGVVFSVQTGVEKYVGYHKDENQEYALAWVLFLGSDDSTYGLWSYKNYMYATQFNVKEERTGELLRTVVKNMSNMGVTGYIRHWMNKTHLFYNDGHFGWGNTGNLVIELSENDSAVAQIIREIFFPPEDFGLFGNYPGYGSYFKGYSLFKQFIWLFVFVFMSIGICRPSKDRRVLILKMTWIGVFLFTMLFETQARLLISYLPIFVLMAGVGAATKEKEERQNYV